MPSLLLLNCNLHVLFWTIVLLATLGMSRALGDNDGQTMKLGSADGKGGLGDVGVGVGEGRTGQDEWRMLLDEYLAGTVAGMVGLVVGYPFDTIKVRMQSPDTAHMYTGGVIRTFAKIVREERVVGLFKGITSPMVTLAPLNGLVFGGYGYFLRLQSPSLAQTPTLAQVAIAGALTGIMASTITTPTELIKIRQQTMTSATGLPSTREVVRTIYRQHGVPGLYRGLTATMFRDAGYGPYFFAYELATRLSPPSPTTPLLAGAVAGIIGWMATFPFDVIKTRVQSVDKDVSGEYRSTWSTTRASWREEGWGVFFRGLRPTLIRAVPVNMATFGTFELVLHLLR